MKKVFQSRVACVSIQIYLFWQTFAFLYRLLRETLSTRSTETVLPNCALHALRISRAVCKFSVDFCMGIAKADKNESHSLVCINKNC